MSARMRAKRMRRERLRQRLQACRTRECEEKARADEIIQKKKDDAQSAREALAVKEQARKDAGEEILKCFITSSGKKMCEQSDGTFKEEGKSKTTSETIKDNLLKQFNVAEQGTTLTFKFVSKVRTKEGRAELVELAIENENKVRAAIVIADAISFGLIVAGSVIAATGVGIPLGASVAGVGITLGAGSDRAEKILDRGIKTLKALQQLEDAVEVARITLSKRVDREKIIEENQEKIDARVEELLDFTTTILKAEAAQLGLAGVSSFKKADLAKVIAETEIVGLVSGEPRIGKSLISRKVGEKIRETVKDLNEAEEEIKDIAEKLNISEEKAREFVIKRKAKEEEELRKKEQAEIESLQKEFNDILNQEPVVLEQPAVLDEPVISSTITKNLKPDDTLVATKVNIRGDKPAQTFEFSSITNDAVIDGTSRRKLDDAMKAGLLKKPKNFNNPDKITATQLDNEDITSKVAKQKKATKKVNDSQNIYNELVRDITNSDNCREWLTANANKIAILPKNLKKELRDYCESIMEDDTEDITEEDATELP